MKATLDLMAEEANENHLHSSENTTKSEADTRTSGASSPSIDSFSSNEETFFQAIGSDFRTLAVSFRKTAGGVANFVQRSALNVAAEINRLEENDVQAHLLEQESSDNRSGGEDSAPLRLPWEVPHNSTAFEEDAQLRERILNLSSDDDTFLKPIPEENEGPEFSLDEPRIGLIRRLLEIDDNLASTHARLSGRRDVYETSFWKNYFFRCEMAKEKYLSECSGNEERSLPSQDSLVPAEESESSSSSSKDDSSSFVIPSAPASDNSADFGSSDGSVGSLVIVDSSDCVP